MMALKGFVPASEKGQEGETRRVYGSESEFSQPLLLNEGDPVVRVDFVDTGTGMAPDLMEKMFEPFVTTKEVGYGLGLGLAITYSIIHNHGGYFDVRSKVGEGSQFTVVLAAAEGTAGRSSQLSSPLSVESQSS
jgi:signal transduction histidine kinase